MTRRRLNDRTLNQSQNWNQKLPETGSGTSVAANNFLEAPAHFQLIMFQTPAPVPGLDNCYFTTKNNYLMLFHYSEKLSDDYCQ